MQSEGDHSAATAAPPKLPLLGLGPYLQFTVHEGQARCGLVWMHGLGDTEEGWAIPLEDSFNVSAEIGPCHFFLPRAPERKVTCHDGDESTSWFDMTKLPLHAKDTPPRHGCSLEEALAACGCIHAAIDRLIAEGIPPAQIVVGGFSQGGAMALLATFTYPKPLRGIIVFSGIVFFQDCIGDLLSPHYRKPKVFWGHGTKDDVFDVSLQTEGVNALLEAGFDVTSKSYTMTHCQTHGEMEDASRFYNGLFGTP